MLAGYSWRLDARLYGTADRGWVRPGIRRTVRRLVDELRMTSTDGVMISRHERDPAALVAIGRSRREVETVERWLRSYLGDRGLTATIAIDRWSDTKNQWDQVVGPVEREERMGRHGLDDSRISFRMRVIAITAAVLLAAAGVTFYAVTPYTFGAFQASTFGILPLLVTALVWLHRRVPMWAQWTGAIILFPLGFVGYLVFGGAQWWNFGQLAALPFLLLVFARPSDRDSSGWDPGFLEPPVGPFGPP